MTPRRRRMAYVAVWTAVFATMSAAQGVGDRHPGQWLPFWQQACIDERPHACLYLVTRQSTHCDQGSGWACNEAGTLQVALWRRGRAAGRFDAADAAMTFERGCELGFTPACENLLAVLAGSGAVASGPPPLKEYPIILRGSKGPITDVAPAAVLAQACTQGWPDTCAPGSGTSR